MPHSRSIFYHAMMLTGVNLLLRLLSTGFNIFLSRRIGAEGVGLVQLTLSVTAMATTAAIAGVRTATMYLCADSLGRQKAAAIPRILSACFLYSLFCSGFVAAAVFYFAPAISAHWIGYGDAVQALRVFAAFLPVTCLTCVMSGYFTAASRITELSLVEIFEQFFAMAVTVLLLMFYVRRPEKAAVAVITGTGAGYCLTLFTLSRISARDKLPPGEKVSVGPSLLSIAVPLAVADNLKACISTVENLMVPRRLALHPGIQSPLAQFGTVCGMVFPVIMFPAAILFGLGELLIPEMARCRAAGSGKRISYLVQRSLRFTLLFGLSVAGILFLTSRELCRFLYKTDSAALFLSRFSLLIPMLYCDAVTDAMVKGLGQQRACVRYNIITSAMDVVFLYFLLPVYGMDGYYFSFLITHLLNFILSLRRLLLLSRPGLMFHIPVSALADAGAALLLASFFSFWAARVGIFLCSFAALLYATGAVSAEDIRWLSGMIKAPALSGRRHSG